MVSIGVNQHERYEGFADTQTLRVFPMSTARAASQRHTEHRHRQITAILDTCFHTDIDELIHAHPPRESGPECIVVGLLFTAHSGARQAARLWQKCFHSEAFMSSGWNAEAMEPNADHQTEDLNDDDNATKDGHSDIVMVEMRIDVFQDVKAMKEHKVDFESVDNHWNGDQEREASLILETSWCHVGQNGAERSSADAEHVGRAFLGSRKGEIIG